MKRRNVSKLILSTETVRNLQAFELNSAAGGYSSRCSDGINGGTTCNSDQGPSACPGGYTWTDIGCVSNGCEPTYAITCPFTVI